MFDLDMSSGALQLSDAVTITGGMPREVLEEDFKTLTGKPCYTDDLQRPSVMLSGTFFFAGLEAACTCLLHRDTLRMVGLCLINGTATEQRDALYRCLGQEEADPKKIQSLLFQYPFGTAWMAADQRSGNTALRITYTVKE